jgi:hypothetical protein
MAEEYREVVAQMRAGEPLVDRPPFADYPGDRELWR